MVWVDRSGKETSLAAPPRAYSTPRVSPDGRTVVAQTPAGVWVYDVSRDMLSRLNADASNPSAWTSDGKRVAFQIGARGKVNIFWQNADGSGQPEQLAVSDNRQAAGSFSRDGQFLAFNEQASATGADIWIMRMSDHTVKPFIQIANDQGGPKFSPDGHWLAYVSDESGRKEIYVQPFPGPGAKHQMSIEGGVEPVWNPNGRELFYRTGDNMMAVEITAQPAFAAAKPRVLWTAIYRRAGGNLPSYDVAPDGRFLMLKSAERPATQINVVLNWLEELKQRVPVK